MRPDELERSRYELVADVKGVDLDQRRNDHQVAVRLEDYAELGGGHEERSEAVLEDGAVLAVKKKGTVDDV